MEAHPSDVMTSQKALPALLARIRSSRRSFYLCVFVILVVIFAQTMVYFGFWNSYNATYQLPLYLQRNTLKNPTILANVRQIMDSETATLILKEDLKLFKKKHTVPKIIHQIYRDENIPFAYVEYIKSWVCNNPDYEYWLWDDKTGRDFIVNYFPDFLPMYDAYCHDLYRSDALRYFILYKFGGIYADMDYQCLKNFDDLISDGQCYLVRDHEHQSQILFNRTTITNSWMASTPGHPFMKYTINSLPTIASCENILHVTGPLFLNKTLLQYNKVINCNSPYCRITLLENEIMMPEWDTSTATTMHLLFECRKFGVAGTLTQKQRKACAFFKEKGLSPDIKYVNHYASHKFLHLGSSARLYPMRKVNIRTAVPNVVFPRAKFTSKGTVAPP